MPPKKNPDWISWRDSIPKAIIVEDLITGILPLDDGVMSAEEAWKMYGEMVEFKEAKVVFSQFKARLKDHRKQVEGDFGRAQEEAKKVTHDRALFPRKLTNSKGELVFDLHPAKDLLRADIEKEKHKGKKPSELWASHSEYKQFDKGIF